MCCGDRQAFWDKLARQVSCTSHATFFIPTKQLTWRVFISSACASSLVCAELRGAVSDQGKYLQGGNGAGQEGDVCVC